jgi:hypothetical protein
VPKTARTVVLPPAICLGTLSSNYMKPVSIRRAFGDGCTAEAFDSKVGREHGYRVERSPRDDDDDDDVEGGR